MLVLDLAVFGIIFELGRVDLSKRVFEVGPFRKCIFFVVFDPVLLKLDCKFKFRGILPVCSCRVVPENRL